MRIIKVARKYITDKDEQLLNTIDCPCFTIEKHPDGFSLSLVRGVLNFAHMVRIVLSDLGFSPEFIWIIFFAHQRQVYYINLTS